MASVKVPLSAGGIIPRDLNARQFSEWASSQSTKNIFAGATGYNSGTGVWFGEDTDGTVKWFVGDASGNKVTWDGSTLSITGTITATTGTIGGWTLSATALTSGSGATTVGLDSGGTNPAIYAGSATPASAPFRVTQAGAVTATSGSIGGWTLSASSLSAGSGANSVLLDSGGTNPAIAIGSTTPASAPFRVTPAGALTATNATITGSITSTSGTIGGWTLAATSLTSGSGANTVGIDSGGTNPAFYAGSATPASAPFRVTQAGALTATSATITGTINISNTTQTFTPTWTGFSSDPSGDISYIDLGAIVFMWRGVALVGTSDDVLMSFTGVPAAIRPSTGRFVSCHLIDGSTVVTLAGSAFVNSSGTIQFGLQDAVSQSPNVEAWGTDNFQNTGTKGLPSGWLIVYPK